MYLSKSFSDISIYSNKKVGLVIQKGFSVFSFAIWDRKNEINFFMLNESKVNGPKYLQLKPYQNSFTISGDKLRKGSTIFSLAVDAHVWFWYPVILRHKLQKWIHLRMTKYLSSMCSLKKVCACVCV